MDQRGDEEDELNIRAQIDQRLKMIQNEEEMPGVSEKSYETDEEIVERLRRDETKENQPSEDVLNLEQKETDPAKHVLDTVTLPTEEQKTDTNKISKVYIGQFSDMQKAVEMQANLFGSGLDINPIIKEVNGYYTIQAGAFANYEMAKAFVETLNNAGFSAKIVKEIK